VPVLYLLVWALIGYGIYHCFVVRPKKRAEQERQAREHAEIARKAAEKQKEERVIEEIKSGKLFQKCCKILDGYSKIIQNKAFGTLVRTELQIVSHSGNKGAIKLVVARYSGHVNSLIEGDIPNPFATPENYKDKFIVLNHGDMYDYLFSKGFPDDFGSNIELYPTEDNDYAEWVVFLYQTELEIVYRDDFHYRIATKWITEELKHRYPQLKIILAPFIDRG